MFVSKTNLIDYIVQQFKYNNRKILGEISSTIKHKFRAVILLTEFLYLLMGKLLRSCLRLLARLTKHNTYRFLDNLLILCRNLCPGETNWRNRLSTISYNTKDNVTSYCVNLLRTRPTNKYGHRKWHLSARSRQLFFLNQALLSDKYQNHKM